MTAGNTFLIYSDGGIYDWISTCPGRKLVLDSEFHTSSIAGEVVNWSGQGAFPECGEDATVVVPVVDAQALSLTINAIKSGKLPIQSVIITSITMLQMNEQQKQFNGPPTNQQDWGKLLKAFSSSVVSLLTAARDPRTPIECVVITAGSKEHSNGDSVRLQPFVDGALLNHLKMFTDIIGFISKRRVKDGKINQLQVDASDLVYARCTESALDKYNGFIQDPNISKIISEIKK